MSESKVRGVVHLIEDTKTYGQNGFRKRLIVLERDEGRFTNYIPIEFVQDRCDDVDSMKKGEEVEVTYRLSGRKWQRDANSEVKYFLNLEATDFRALGGGDGGGGGAPASEHAPDVFDESEAPLDDEEIPF